MRTGSSRQRFSVMVIKSEIITYVMWEGALHIKTVWDCSTILPRCATHERGIQELGQEARVQPFSK